MGSLQPLLCWQQVSAVYCRHCCLVLSFVFSNTAATMVFCCFGCIKTFSLQSQLTYCLNSFPVHWDRHIHFLQNQSQTENNSNVPISSDDGDNDGHLSDDTTGRDIDIVSPSNDNEEEETTPSNLF